MEQVNSFAKAFDGVAKDAIDWMRWFYNIPAVAPAYFAQGKTDAQMAEEAQATREVLQGQWVEFYNKVLPERIERGTEAFIAKFGDGFEAIGKLEAIVGEVSKNLNDCQTVKERNDYAIELLIPFGEGRTMSGWAKIFQPDGELERLQGDILRLQKEEDLWQKVGKKEAVRQIRAIKEMIERDERQIDWTKYVNRRFCWICSDSRPGTVEGCLQSINTVHFRFVNIIDALLLKAGVDLLEVQKYCGIFLKSYRITTELDYYTGSSVLTQRYIEALHPGNSKNEGISEPQQLPDELDTKEAREVLEKAKEKGFCSVVDGRWKWAGSFALLGYFVKCMNWELTLSDGVRLKWRPFKELFRLQDRQVRTAQQALSEVMNSVSLPPEGAEVVDEIMGAVFPDFTPPLPKN